MIIEATTVSLQSKLVKRIPTPSVTPQVVPPRKSSISSEKHPYRGHSRLPNSVIAVVS
jgi:hypothetical protein